jgi:SAM-dependent methyltransferase
MIDINKTLDLVKLKFYNEWIYTSCLNDEPEAVFHQKLTDQFVRSYIDNLNLPKQANILDMGCGHGYFLDLMRNRGYTNLTGITISDKHAKVCRDKGHNVKEYDFTFLPQKDGYVDESVDFIFMRHAIERSPYPIFTLMEYNRLLKLKGKIYIETPSPDCQRGHEFHQNNYSIMGSNQLKALLSRTGFEIDVFNTVDFDLTYPLPDKEDNVYKEKYFCIVATKTRPIDVK